MRWRAGRPAVPRTSHRTLPVQEGPREVSWSRRMVWFATGLEVALPFVRGRMRRSGGTWASGGDGDRRRCGLTLRIPRRAASSRADCPVRQVGNMC